MGATNTTTFYNLSQFIGTDKPAWLQDYNGDMLKIDTAINAAKTAADSAANAASAAQNDATTALGDIATINGTISTMSTTLGTAVGNINTINSLIGNGTPTTTDQTIIGAINELHADILPLNNKYVVKSVYNSLNIKGDGVKDLKTLLSEFMSSTLQNVVNNLEAGEVLKIEEIYVAGIGDVVPVNFDYLPRAATVVSCSAVGASASGSSFLSRAVTLNATAASCVATEAIFNGSDNTFTVTSKVDNVIANDTIAVQIRYGVYHKMTV